MLVATISLYLERTLFVPAATYIHMYMYIVCVVLYIIISLSECKDGIWTILTDSSYMKMSRDNALRALLASASEKLSDEASPPHSSLVNSTFWALCAQQLQTLALDSGLR